MTQTKTLLLISTLFIFSACRPATVSVEKGGYFYNSIYFGKDVSSNYKKGIHDGCTTAKGRYKKAHRLFKSDKQYNKGWFAGRNKCQDLLKLNKKGDVIN